MTIQYSTAVRNARADAVTTTIGASPKLRIYTGTVPANCATAASGTMLIEVTLPASWMTAAANGVKSLLGTWAGTFANSGTTGYYRIYDNAGTTCHEQGSIPADMSMDNPAVVAAQAFSVTTFTRTEPGA